MGDFLDRRVGAARSRSASFAGLLAVVVGRRKGRDLEGWLSARTGASIAGFVTLLWRVLSPSPVHAKKRAVGGGPGSRRGCWSSPLLWSLLIFALHISLVNGGGLWLGWMCRSIARLVRITCRFTWRMWVNVMMDEVDRLRGHCQAERLEADAGGLELIVRFNANRPEGVLSKVISVMRPVLGRRQDRDLWPTTERLVARAVWDEVLPDWFVASFDRWSVEEIRSWS